MLGLLNKKPSVNSKHIDQGLINHVAIVLDASGSMGHLSSSVKKLLKQQISEFAKLSTQMNQETRVTVYTFSDATDINCLAYDCDVLRMPEVASGYKINGMTALVDSVGIAIEDLEKTAQIYGDHSFIVYVITDGVENASRFYHPADVKKLVHKHKDEWTIAALVPDSSSIDFCKQYLGLAPGNIKVWEATKEGVEKVSQVIRTSTTAYMDARSKGVKSVDNLFDLSEKGVTKAVAAGALEEMPERHYAVVRFTGANHRRIDDVVQDILGFQYSTGTCYYQLGGRKDRNYEDVQYHKDVAIRHKETLKVYRGPVARQMIGIVTNQTVRLTPLDNPDYDVFIQSTSNNRSIYPGTDLLYFHTFH